MWFPKGLILGLVLLTACSDAGSSGAPGESAGQQEVRDPNEPGVWEIAPNVYEAVIVAFEGGFDPSEVRVPVGAEVRFRARSADLVHGFLIEGTDIEMEVDTFDPVTASHTFDVAGEYALYCHIYCGGGHPSMMGKVIVE